MRSFSKSNPLRLGQPALRCLWPDAPIHGQEEIGFLPNVIAPDKVNGVSTNTLTDIRKVRLEKAAALRAAGLDPYPSRSKRTHLAKTILDDFARHENQPVTVAGRLISWRKQGALAFGHV